jgi:hypothetical protein
MSWRTRPFCVEDRADDAPCFRRFRDFDNAFAAIAAVLQSTGQADFWEPPLNELDGSLLTYGGELPALISQHSQVPQETPAS